jgi:hypothetical protein
MPAEPGVLVQQHALHQRGRHLRQRHPLAVLVVGAQGQAQQFAVCAVDGGGRSRMRRQRRMRIQADAGQHEREQRDADQRVLPAQDPSPDCLRGLHYPTHGLSCRYTITSA